MSSKVTEGIQNSKFAFLNFKSRQNVSKSKLQDNVQNAWNTCSSGFEGDIITSYETKRKKLHQKSYGTGEDAYPLERNSVSSLHERLLGNGYKSVKRKSMLEIGNFDADFFSPQKRSEPYVISSDQFLKAVKTPDNRHTKAERKSNSHNVPKKQCDLLVQNIDNPFRNNVTKASIVSPDSKTTFPSDKLSEQENIYKKRKMPDGNFIDSSGGFPSPYSVKEVLKKSVQSSSHHHNKCIELSRIVKNSISLDTSLPIEQFADKNKTLHHKSLSHSSESLSYSSIFIHPKVCLNDSSTNKGSNWVQSLQWAPPDQDDSNQDRLKKKKLRNTVPGGYAEKMLKLQRREQSEKVIWEHKKDHNQEREVKNAVLMHIIAVSQAKNDIVITKCRCYATDYATLTHQVESLADNKMVCESNSVSIDEVHTSVETVSNDPECKLCLVLFKKNHFCQLHLKTSDSFRLFPPWKILNSSPFLVVLCTHFVESIPSTADFSTPCNIVDKQTPLNSNVNPPICNELCPLTITKEPCFKWEERKFLAGRVQRIWYKSICPSWDCNELSKCYRLTLLIQEKDETLSEVIVSSSSSFPDHWLQLLSFAEGKCFIFNNLYMTRRLQFDRHGGLLKFLKSFRLKSSCIKMDQKYSYQFMYDVCSNIPEEICGENFPPYLLPEIELMSNLSEVPSHSRVSFIGNILLQRRNVLFVSDKSLLHAPLKKYVEMHLLAPFEKSENGCLVFIREALIDDGSIILDKYSALVVLSELSNVHSTSNLFIQFQKQIKHLTPVKLQQVIMPFSSLSMIADIVSIEGVIKSVNETTAVSFLQCCFCLQENLIQDSNLVIYCEDCSLIVPKPVLGIKLEVSLCCKSYKSASVDVLLLSSTVKSILNINDDTYQPQCRVADVLGKQIGPIICYVKSCETIGRNQVFYLQEIKR